MSFFGGAGDIDGFLLQVVPDGFGIAYITGFDGM
jgi:hypothetical protein